MRKKPQTQHQVIEKQFKLEIAELTLMALVFVSVGLGIWGADIYRSTLIPTKYLFTTAAFATIVTFPSLLFGVKTSYSTLWIFLMSIVIGGSIACTLLLFINSTVTDGEKKIEDFDIIKRTSSSYKGRCASPVVTIDFYGMQKEFTFSCDYASTIKNYSKVRLEYTKGALGFEVILVRNLQK